MTTQLAQVEEPIDAAQQMIGRHMRIEVEGVEQLVLRTGLLTHHRDVPSSLAWGFRLNLTAFVQESFSTK